MKKELGIGILLLILCVVVTILNPQFISPHNLTNTANLVGIYGIFSIGLGIVIITGGIDLSVGAVFALQGIVFAMSLSEWHWSWPVAVLFSLLIAIAIGVYHGFLITVLKLQPFIVTLCGLLYFRGLARGIAHEETKGFDKDSYGLLTLIGKGSVFGIPCTFWLLIVISVIMWVVLHRSVYGRYLYAVGRNEDAARYSGIPTRLVIGSAYVVSMFLTGISGLLLAFYTPGVAGSTHGLMYELYGIAAAVLGGCSLRGGEGSIIGILIGTILLQVLQNLVNLLGIPSSQNFTVMGVVILLGVSVDQVLRNRKRRGKVISLTTPAELPIVPAASGAGGQTPSA